MWTDRVHLLRDVSDAEWIGERLAPVWRTIAGAVPSGFEAYARVLHPVDTGEGATLRWADAAEATGRRVHPTVQWHALIGARAPYTGSDLWQDGEPQPGNLALEPLLELCAVLARHTTTPDDWRFAMWEGWGQLHGSRTWLTSEGGVPAEPLLTADELAAPRLHLPGRDYLLFRGPAAAMKDLVQYDGPSWWTQSPALFWPADRAWCVATEIDFDSTLVGGTADAVDDVLVSSVLEALPIGLDDSLQADGDHVNRT